MKFLVDAQLPARLSSFLADAGHDSLCIRETSPSGNRTTDAVIAELADEDDRIVVTKDRDFRDGHLLGRSPRRLLVVATGNITNAARLACSASTWAPSSLPSTRSTSSSCDRPRWCCTAGPVRIDGPLYARPPSRQRDLGAT